MTQDSRRPTLEKEVHTVPAISPFDNLKKGVTASDIARSGYKAYLQALGKTKAELLTMAASVESGIEETIITSLGSEGASSSAQLSALTKTDRLSVIMEVYAEGNGGRQLGTFANFGAFNSPV